MRITAHEVTSQVLPKVTIPMTYAKIRVDLKHTSATPISVGQYLKTRANCDKRSMLSGHLKRRSMPGLDRGTDRTSRHAVASSYPARVRSAKLPCNPRDTRRLTPMSWIPPRSPEFCGAPILITTSRTTWRPGQRRLWCGIGVIHRWEYCREMSSSFAT